MILKNETDLLIAELGLPGVIELERILTVERDRPGSRRFECAENIEQGALAAARWPHDRNRIASFNCQRDLGKDRQDPVWSGVLFRQIRNLKQLSLLPQKK